MLTHKRKKPGQSLVEFALSATLLFLMLSAIIDLGLAYFAYQGLAGAAQEGASYAALFPTNGNAVNDAEIRQRVRYEGGADLSLPNRVRFIDLMDLNNNKINDNSENASVLNTYIVINVVQNSANEQVGGAIPCDSTSTPPRRTTQYCDMVVQVRYRYKPFFSGASLLGASEIPLSATRYMTISR
jgi:Flp pilus assembly protein TadG